jgi:hypothetical protein
MIGSHCPEAHEQGFWPTGILHTQLAWSGAMEFLPVTERQQYAVCDLVADAEVVTRFSLRIIGRLKALFDDDSAKDTWGVSIDPTDNPTEFDLSTPFGKAKAEVIIAAGEDGVFGKIVIRKYKKNDLGEIVSPIVWFIRVTKDGQVYQGESTTDPISATPQFRSKAESEIMNLGQSLLFTIGAA